MSDSKFDKRQQRKTDILEIANMIERYAKSRIPDQPTKHGYSVSQRDLHNVIALIKDRAESIAAGEQ